MFTLKSGILDSDLGSMSTSAATYFALYPSYMAVISVSELAFSVGYAL